MNQLGGKIKDIDTHESISLVKVISEENILFSSVVIDTPETCKYLQIGSNVSILFKETEVSISKEEVQKISIQNRIPCTIKSILGGAIFTKIELQCGTHEITSIITTNSSKDLKLSINDNVIALIKTNEISLSYHD